MKQLLSILFSIIFCIQVGAQSISVASFSLLENDLTANTAGTTVLDQNGEKCALIKVETTQTGFTFDVGSLGVVKTEQRTAEIWVYVPAGVKRISIAHQRLGRLNDYDLGMTLQRAKTYRMKLTTGTVTTVVEDAVTSQFLLFQVTPDNATVMVNDEVWNVNEGVARKYVPFGTYDYRVMAQDYFTSSGKVTVNDPDNKHIVKVSLKPNFIQVTLRVENQAEIWVNGEQKGRGSWTGNLGGGEYLMETRLAGHRNITVRKTVNPEHGTQTITLPAPMPIYGKLMVSTLPDLAEIYIDDRKVGETPQMLNQVLIGSHKVIIKKNGYKDLTKTVNIAEGQTSNVEGSLVKGIAVSADSSTFTVNGVTFKMIPVQGGTFQMGATSEQQSPYNNEKPLHFVMLGNYSIGETEVTQSLWKAVMGTNPSYFKGNNLPVEQVSWEDCQNFIKKLNRLTGVNFRLPTEAEWEYAARGGNKSQETQYAGSSNINDVAWYGDNSGKTTHAVKTKLPNELGIYDMSGNVWEWCQDWYGNYSRYSQTNPKGPSNGTDRLYRGGGWINDIESCRSANRSGFAPTMRSYTLGIRLAL